jgi:hypothetical protein
LEFRQRRWSGGRTHPVHNGLPPLTILVVQRSTGLPDAQFTAASALEFATQQFAVFEFD